MNWDRAATAIGLGMAAVQAATVDYTKLAQCDHAEIIRLGFAFLCGALGIVTNKLSKPKE